MSTPRHTGSPTRARRHSTVLLCLSMVGVLSFGHEGQIGPGVGNLGAVWDTMDPRAQADICRLIDVSGRVEAARQLLRNSDADASLQDAQYFVNGLACDIRVGIAID